MTQIEALDLKDICWDGYRLDALDDVLALLRAIAWVSPQEKAAFWQSLPADVRDWLSGSALRAAA